MISQFMQYSDLGFFLLRLAVGAIFIYHGWPKVKKPAIKGQGMGLSKEITLVVGLIELVGGAALILGTYVQLASLLISIVMIGAIYFKVSKWHVPFSALDKMGWEFDLVLLAANILLLTNGGGNITL